MKLNQKNTIGLRAGITALLLFFFTTLPGAALAELKKMNDPDMKSTRLNDFVRPLNRAIIVAKYEKPQEDISKQLRETQAPVVTTPETYDPEAFLNDMKAQLEAINNGESPVLGLFPLIRNEEDKQHLLK